MKNCLIVGGSSGLGLSLATKLSISYDVIVTGRQDPHVTGLTFRRLELGKSEELEDEILRLIGSLPRIDLLIYAAGFYQEGLVTDLTPQQMTQMISVCLTGAMLVTRELLLKQGCLDGLITVTSTSEYVPRLLEAVYTAAKAGLGAFTRSLAQDPRVKKTLKVAPAGMNTPFWRSSQKDTSDWLDPNWVADKVLAAFEGDFAIREMDVLRNPPKVLIKPDLKV